ncbi:hypothetical protein BT69DRAFT_1278235 [Atractiella rhizophila]|nr:hypothetical protein BT69DRAFT_1278235 [Atractiella rhizophila]
MDRKEGMGDSQAVAQERDEDGMQDLVLSHQTEPYPPRRIAKLYHLLTHRTLHGVVTSLQRIHTLSSSTTEGDKLLVAFAGSKMALLEWAPEAHDLLPLSLHTYERYLTTVQDERTTQHPGLLQVDSQHRCAALLLPGDKFAVLPFFMEEVDLELVESANASLPYASSFVLEMEVVHPQIRNIKHFVFLEGFVEPTVAILYEPVQTWAGRLENLEQSYALSFLTLSSITLPQQSHHYPLLSTIPSLPYASCFLHPCPASIGGVLLVSSEGIMWIDQSGRLISNGGGTTGWFAEATISGKRGGVGLENASVCWMEERAAIFMQGTEVGMLEFMREGRAVVGLEVRRVGVCVAASCAVSVGDNYTFVGSMNDDSVLLRWGVENVKHEEDTTKQQEAQEVNDDDDMDIDLDSDEEEMKDIYGNPTNEKSSFPQLGIHRANGSVDPKRVEDIKMSICDILEGYGSIRSMAVGNTQDELPPELVACTGGDYGGAITVFHRHVPPRKKRRLDLNQSAGRVNGLWSLRIRMENDQALPTSSVSGAHNLLFASTYDSTNAYSMANEDLEPIPELSMDVTTVAVGSLFNDSCAAQVLPNQIRLLNGDMSLRQVVETEGAPNLRATFADPYVLIIKEDGSSQLFVGDMASRTLGNFDTTMLPHGAKSIFCDITRFAQVITRVPINTTEVPQGSNQRFTAGHKNDMEDIVDFEHDVDETLGIAVGTVEAPVNEQNVSERGTQSGQKSALHWLINCAPDRSLQIWKLPELAHVFEAKNAALLPQLLDEDLFSIPHTQLGETEVQIQEVHVFNVGQKRRKPHLVLWLSSGAIAVYEAVTREDPINAIKPGLSLNLRFVKVAVSALTPPTNTKLKAPEEAGETIGEAVVELVSFENVGGYSGALITGQNPVWILSSDHGHARFFQSNCRSILAFSPCSQDNVPSSYLLQGMEECCLYEIPPNVTLLSDLPYSKIRQGTNYSHIAYDPPSRTFVAAINYKVPYWQYNDEGDRVNKESDISDPYTYRSTLELFINGTWGTLDGYEFAQNESVVCLQSVNLSSKSTVSGRRDFIAAGTMFNRGEDHSAKGTIYVFEVVEIIPNPKSPHDRFRLRLRSQEETKLPINIVGEINGYLIHTLGLKLYAKAWEEDERLLAVGFLDVSTYSTCVRVLKNLILLGDAVRSMSLIAFQEEPYKIVLLGKDFRTSRACTVDFLVFENRVAFVSTDAKGALRVFSFDPANPESHSGSRLLPSTEFQTVGEATTSLMFGKKGPNDDVPKQGGILFATVDGSLASLVPVKEVVYKRLHAIQNQLVRHAQHFSGLNPRNFRAVKNESISRALSKGILDGDLLSLFERLPYGRQVDLTSQIGSDPETILINIRNLAGPW